MEPKYTGTKAQNIAICRKAKRILWNGKGCCPQHKQAWVCWALTDAVHELHGTVSKPALFDRLVKRHIGSHTFMSSFLSQKLGRAALIKMGKEGVQHYRKLMLDSMIKMIEEGKA